MEPILQTIGASQGTFNVNNTTEKTINFDALLILEDTIFTSLKVGGIDVKSDYIADTSVVVKAGSLIRPQNAEIFSGVQLTSGSAIMVL